MQAQNVVGEYGTPLQAYKCLDGLVRVVFGFIYGIADYMAMGWRCSQSASLFVSILCIS